VIGERKKKRYWVVGAGFWVRGRCVGRGFLILVDCWNYLNICAIIKIGKRWTL